MAPAELHSADANKSAWIPNRWRMLLLCRQGAEVLGEIFRDRWALSSTSPKQQQQQPSSCTHLQTTAHQQWEDGTKCGEELFRLCGKEVKSKVKDKLREGDARLWDITMLGIAIQVVSSKSTRKMLDVPTRESWKHQDVQISKVMGARNNISHEPEPELSDDLFTENWTNLSDALVELGADHTELEALKDRMPSSATSEAANVNPEMVRLKEEANRAFEAKQYPQAIALYSRALKLDGLSNEQLAILFSKRSVSHLLVEGQKAMKSSTEDAKMAVSLRPEWWRAHYCLGKSYNARQKWGKAICPLEIASTLNPGAKEVTDALSAARHEYGMVSRHEHMTPSQQPKTEQEVYELVAEVLETSPKVIALAGRFVERMPIHGDVRRGHRYLNGYGVEQDYKKAAGYFAKAAAKGSPEGMYNLARLHDQGLGVQRDYDISLDLLYQAASMTPNPPLFSKGIAEAQFSLGLKYSEGVGVERNYNTAAEWYRKAVVNCSAPAANNLGLLYQNGTGSERSLEKAKQLFELSAQLHTNVKLNDTNGMMNLANCYLGAMGTGHGFATREDQEEAIKWLTTAASLGDLNARRRLDQIKNCSEVDLMRLSMHISTPAELADPLDHKQHYTAVKLAADNGSTTAMQVLTIWECMKESWSAFKSGDPKALVTSLSRAIRLDFQIVSIPELFHQMLNDRLMDHPDELESIVCHVATNTKNAQLGVYVLDKLEKFPTDAFLMETCAAWFLTQKTFDGALLVLSLALMLYPKSCSFLYMRATVFAMMDDKCEEAHDAFNAFLAVAPADHPKVPTAYYRKTEYYREREAVDGNMADFIRVYEAGLAAEKIQLPCFLPYDYPPKYQLEKLYDMAKMRAQT